MPRGAVADLEPTPDDIHWGFIFGCDGFITVAKAAAELDKSPDTIYRYRDDGLIRTTGSGRVLKRKHVRDELVCLRSWKLFKQSLQPQLRGVR